MFLERIKKNIINVNYKNDIVVGDLCCCNQFEFELYEFNDENIIIDAVCSKCNKKFNLYNSLTDGYNNCISKHINKNIKLKKIYCKKCKKSHFKVNIKLEYPPLEELLEDKIYPVDNAFSWIWITLTCCNCKKKYKNYVNEETA